MKYIKLLVLITLLISFWSGAASATAIQYYVIANDKGYGGGWMADLYYNGYFSYKDSASAANTLCVPDGRWVTPSGTYYIGPLGWTGQYPILTSDSDPTGGCLAAVKSVCLGRYQFGRVYYRDGVSSAEFNNLRPVNNPVITENLPAPNAGYVKVCPSSSSITLPYGNVTLVTEYDKYARVLQNIYVFNPATGIFEYQSGQSTSPWFAVGSSQTYTAPNRESSLHQFYYTASHHGSWGQRWSVTPSGTVHDEVNVASDEIIDWHYYPGRSTTIVANSSLPAWVKTQFEAQYDIRSSANASKKAAATTEYWTSYGTNTTIILPEKISRVDSNAEELWVLNTSGLALPAGATLSYDSANRTYRILQTNQTANTSYNIVYNRLSVSVDGIDTINKPLLQKISAFIPRPAAGNIDNAVSFSLNDMHLTAPNLIYADDAGKPNTVRYVLTGWTATGITPLSGTASPGMTTTITPAITATSTITWNYKKQIRVTVTTSGEKDPLKVYDMGGDTTVNSDTITIITTSWDEFVDDNGNAVTTPIHKSLAVNMLVWGNGIEDGARVTEVGFNWVRLSTTAKLTFTKAAGQWLTFSTQKVYERPCNTQDGNPLVSNIDSTGLMAGMSVSGPGIEDGTTILSIDSANQQITLSSIVSLTLAAANGQALAFGSADARECQAINDFTPANCAAQSGVRFYDFDAAVSESSPPSQVSKVSFTAKNQFVESENDENGIPQLKTRTVNQVIYTDGAAVANTEQMVNGRKVLMSARLFKPMTVTWRYNATKAFTIGQPIKPPNDRNDIDREKPPTIIINTPAIPADTTDNAFDLAWDTSTSVYTYKGDVTANSDIVTNITTTGLTEGMYVSGSGIPDKTKVKSVDSSSQVTLTSQATGAAAAMDLTFTSRQGLRYFPIHPVTSFTINWPIKNSSTPFAETGTTIWPVKQPHITGVPANLQPPGAVNSFDTIRYPATGVSAASMGVFKPGSAGTYILRFRTPKKLPDLQSGTEYIVVESTALRPDQYELNDWDVGRKITSDGHSDPENKTGYVFYEGAGYDGLGPNKAYDRDARTGTIIPVNESLPGDVNPLIVVWYKTGQGGIGWPMTPMRYNAGWPEAEALPDPVPANRNSLQTITIGTGEPVSTADTPRPQAMVYNQPDASQPGFNPNEEHALINNNKLYALRNDLNGVKNLSKPYVLLKYFDTVAQEWKMDVYKVERPASFEYAVKAGMPILAPLPSTLQTPAPPDNKIKPGSPGQEWYLLDQKGGHWAKAANSTGTSSFIMQWYYYMSSDFYWPVALPAYTAKKVGDVVPFLNSGTNPSIPIDVTYITSWPTTLADGITPLPVLPVGDTLTIAKNNLPDIYNFKVAEVVFDENVYKGEIKNVGGNTINKGGPLVKLYAPQRYFFAPLAALPSKINRVTVGDYEVFPDLPFALQSRLAYEKATNRLVFKGVWISAEGEVKSEPTDAMDWLLPNLMTGDEKNALKTGFKDSTGVDCGATPANSWCLAINSLFDQARNPNNLVYPAGLIANPFNLSLSDDVETWQTKWGISLGLSLRDNKVASARSIVGEKNALSAGMAQGEGYVVVAANNLDNPAVKDLPVSLYVLKVTSSPVFQGTIKAIKSTNVFDEKLTMHYTGDFGGEPERFTFEWYYQPVKGNMPPLPDPGAAPTGWFNFVAAENPTGAGLTDITIKGASPLTMSDNWVVARYYYKNAWPTIALPSSPSNPATPHDDLNNWSRWSGANTIDTPMLAMGWIKRVIDGLNPLEARVSNFRDNATNTMVSMLSQFGTRYEGDIAFNNDPNYLNSLGLISAYESVLNRGRLFSIDSQPPLDEGPTNDALLNISSRLATFYLALGNEAYADAVDPTIGFSTKSAEYGNMAPSVFAFQNQVDSLLEEELALMRGRDDSAGSTKNPPYYNRMIWNFTQGEGEVAYAQNYNVTDQDRNGFINAADARIMYPQGHGDAWGHYLQSITYYYKLLGHRYFTWQPRVEFVTVSGIPTMVDYLDERKFASIAAARAKTGAEILDATYRQFYTDDPAGQWQGYKDSYSERAWGVDEWARRAGQAAFFDWATANAILPETSPPGTITRTQYVTENGVLVAKPLDLTTDLQKIDRTKTPELAAIASQFHKMQAKMTEVDGGINPLGLVKGVVPFDIDPAVLDASMGIYSMTHFEQIYARAEKALENAFASYDYANGYTQRLRQNQDTLEEFKKNLTDQERDYRNRLIEIFGYPYPDDIGAGKTYPDGYDGPDIFHYNYVDYTELTGKKNQGFKNYKRTFNFAPSLMTSLGNLPALTAEDATVNADVNAPHQISYNIATDTYWQVKDPTWTLNRKAPGRIQQALSDLIVAEANYNKAVIEFNNMTGGIEDATTNLLKRHDVLAEQIKVRNDVEKTLTDLDISINVMHAVGLAAKRTATIAREVSETIVEAIPDDINAWGGDIMSPASSAVRTIAFFGAWVADIAGDVTDMAEFSMGTAKERVQAGAELKLVTSEANYEIWKLVQDINAMIAEVDPKLLETYQLKETLQQAVGNYQAALAEGVRLMDEREEKRKQSAAEVQAYRYQDLGFRVFRNDAIQKYRAQFDLAAKYVYLAATAYDYETNLLGTASGAGRKFLGEIARQRTLGVVSNGVPQAGFPGLADVMARLSQNFAVYKTQLGFNNPQTETTPFSLRSELFRIKSDATSNADWRDVLKDHKVDDLWKIPEFKRFCRPFAPESAGPQPGIVIKFPTTVTYGKNFFGWPLSGGDSAYSTSNFSTRVRSVGLWFQNYNGAGLSSTPRVYLVPTGADVLRSPTGDGFATREWQVRDQKLPVPFPIGDTDLKNPSFIPVNDSLSDELSGIRKVSDFRAYPYSGEFDPSQATTDSRLIGRSVWNTQWMLIIPGSTLLFNKDVGLNTFINSVDDIKMFFQTYAYSGN
jgi:hypothetical protein